MNNDSEIRNLESGVAQTYDIVPDASGEDLFVERPTDAEMSAARDLVRKWPRFLGAVAVAEGSHEEVMLGMLDQGMTMDDTIESLVVHGELPADAESDAAAMIVLEADEHGWHLRSSSAA